MHNLILKRSSKGVRDFLPHVIVLGQWSPRLICENVFLVKTPRGTLNAWVSIRIVQMTRFNHLQHLGNTYDHWFNEISNKFSMIIRWEHLPYYARPGYAEMPSCLMGKTLCPFQVILRCIHCLHMWFTLHWTKYQLLFKAMCMWSGRVAKEVCTQHGWQHNVRIGPLLYDMDIVLVS